MGVTWDLSDAESPQLSDHALARLLLCFDEIELVLLDHPAGDVAGIIGDEIRRGGKGLQIREKLGVHAEGGGDEEVVKEVLHQTGGVRPAGLGSGIAFVIPHLVVMTSFSLPRTVRVGIKGPVGQVNAVERVGERFAFELVGCKPMAAIPFTDFLPDPGVGDSKGQDTAGANGGISVLGGDDGGRAAEVAVLSDPFFIEDGNRVAAPAAHGLRCRSPAAFIFRQIAQSGEQIHFLDQDSV